MENKLPSDIKEHFETWALKKMYSVCLSSWIQLDDKRGYYGDVRTNDLFVAFMVGYDLRILP